MSDSDASRIKLEKAHQQELKELRAKIDEILKQPTDSKAARKATVAETQLMEDDMRARHLQEMADLLTSPEDEIDYEELSKLSVQPTAAAPAQEKKTSEPKPVVKKVSRAQKRRDAKADEERTRREKIEAAKEEEESLSEKETEALRVKLLQMRLESVDIASDGNCLYHSIGHQLALRGNATMKDAFLLRAMASQYMLDHPDDFIPFMEDETEDYEQHCHKVATQQSLWGGQMEALAISNSLQLPIWILSFDQPNICFGDQFLTHDSPIVVTFHRYLFALGKHYNSTRPVGSQLEPSF